MKGHVGGGPRFGVSGSGDCGKTLSLYVSIPQAHRLNCRFVSDVVQTEWTPEHMVCCIGIPRYGGLHELESLILAQNERWRHA